MPVERRDVLFSLGEINPVLVRAAGRSSGHIPGNLSSMSVIEVKHTRDLSTAFHDQRTRLLALLKEAPEGDGVIFRATKPGTLIGERTLAFFVPDNVMLDALLAACASLSIALPRRPNKLVIAEDLKIGLRIILDDNALELEK
jgi:hypothetical protein